MVATFTMMGAAAAACIFGAVANIMAH
jgi:hypothetical protein